MSESAVPASNVNPNEKMASLLKEAENLKIKLEEERQKLNDVNLSNIAERLEQIAYVNIKPRKVLKGHQAKVLCTDWSPDKRHIISSSQDGRLIIWDAFTTNKEHAVTMPTTWIMACAYAPSGNFVACGGLDNKVTVYPITSDEEMAAKKRTVGTHTSYMSCCIYQTPISKFLLAVETRLALCGMWNLDSCSKAFMAIPVMLWPLIWRRTRRATHLSPAAVIAWPSFGTCGRAMLCNHLKVINQTSIVLNFILVVMPLRPAPMTAAVAYMTCVPIARLPSLPRRALYLA